MVAFMPREKAVRLLSAPWFLRLADLSASSCSRNEKALSFNYSPMLPSACCQVITSLHVSSIAKRLHGMDYIRDAPVELSQELLRDLASTYSLTQSGTQVVTTSN